MVLEFLQELPAGAVVIRPLAKRPGRSQHAIAVHNVWLILPPCIVATDPWRKASGVTLLIPCLGGVQLRFLSFVFLATDTNLAEHTPAVRRGGVSY